MNREPGAFRSGIRRLFRLDIRRASDTRQEMDEELHFHLEARTTQLMAQGAEPEAARREALRRMGLPYTAARDQLRRSARRRERRLALRERLEALYQDVRYAWRGLAQRPGFTAVAVLTLAIGIGANTAIFTTIDALLLRALPFRDPAALMDIVQRTPFDPAQGGIQDSPWSYPKFLTFRDGQQVYRDLAVYSSGHFILTGADPERVNGEQVSSQFLTTLGVQVALGHDFSPEDDSHLGATRTVIISQALWQRRFHADPHVVGMLLRVDSSSYQVIGVLPAAFRGMSGQADVLLPVSGESAGSLNAWDFELAMIGRLKPGITPGQADRDARRLAPIVYHASPLGEGSLSSTPNGAWGAAARPLDSIRVASPLRRSLLVLFGAVGMLLLIACVNVANLLLGRAATRRQEIAVRLALGAGRARLLRLLMCESLLLASVGGALGLALAWGATKWLLAIDPDRTLDAQGLSSGVGAVRFDTVHFDLRAVGFALAVTLLVTIVFGLLPARQATRPMLAQELREGSAASGRGSARIGASRRLLVVVEVALAVVLLAGSGLMLRSLLNTLAVQPGFRADRLLTLRVEVPEGGVAKDSLPGFYQQVQERLRAVPGVRDAALIDCPPVSGGCNGTLLTFADRPPSATGNPVVGVHWVSPNWFGELQVPLLHGRMFDAGDRNGAPRVVLVSETAARRLWPRGDAIGQRVKVFQGGFDAGATVVGVVGDVRFGLIDSLPAPDVYISVGQGYRSRMMIFLATTGDPAQLIPSVRRALQEVAPHDPVYDIATMVDRVGAASAQARYSAVLLLIFGGVALGLAVIGIYGVLAFGVTQRQREIGIRMALGARQGTVLAMILREAALLVGLGAAAGIALALGTTRLLASLLYDVAPNDPRTYLAIIAVIALAAAFASWLPARRASRVDPTEALRRG